VLSRLACSVWSSITIEISFTPERVPWEEFKFAPERVPWEEAGSYPNEYHGKSQVHTRTSTMGRVRFTPERVPWEDSGSHPNEYHGKS